MGLFEFTMYPTLTDEEQEYVINCILTFINKKFKMASTNQEHFWKGSFGKEYTDRNSWNDDEGWDKTYRDNWGMTKLEINEKILKAIPRDIKILEVGCNYGAQLRGFQRMGFEIFMEWNYRLMQWRKVNINFQDLI
jgi:hypothetical protein